MSDPGTFVSSIKVKGIQFLPPVINSKRRAEIERDRQQAIKLEKRLQNTRKLKKDLDDLLSIHIISNRSQSAKSHHREKNLQITSPVQLKKKVNLSKLIVDVSEYSNDGIKLIDKDFGSMRESFQDHIDIVTPGYDTDITDTLSNKTDASSSKTCEISGFSLTSKSTSSKGSSVEQCPLLDLSRLSNGTSQTQTPSPRKSPKPRLIRSNSYTLEAPSPILLAHLEKCGKTNQDKVQIEEPVLSRTWSSMENNYVPFEQSEFSSLNTVYHFNDKPEASDKTEKIAEQQVPEKDCPKDLSPTIEVIQTDISVQQITVNANTDRVEPVKTTLDLSDPDCQLMEVLKKIPEDYSRQIVELIEKQRSEHNIKVDNFGKQFNRNIHCSTPSHDEDKSNYSVVSASPSQSIYYSFGSSDTMMPSTPLARMADLDTCREEGSFRSDFSKENTNRDVYERGASQHDDSRRDFGRVVNRDIYESGARQQDDTRRDFGRKVFSSNYGNIDSIKKEWAACVIGAHAKGYLTRRLLKTERVQSLIETIRDALLCALQLHAVENIDEADIELHRRLINQVSAACYEFHDIFFSLSITDKMSVISTDRKRRMEKAKRSKSGSDLRSVSNSSRSSTRSVASLTSSLTKI